MVAKQTYLEPTLVDLGDLVVETRGVEDDGNEIGSLTKPAGDI